MLELCSGRATPARDGVAIRGDYPGEPSERERHERQTHESAMALEHRSNVTESRRDERAAPARRARRRDAAHCGGGDAIPRVRHAPNLADVAATALGCAALPVWERVKALTRGPLPAVHMRLAQELTEEPRPDPTSAILGWSDVDDADLRLAIRCRGRYGIDAVSEVAWRE
jgi:hypothetical protein